MADRFHIGFLRPSHNTMHLAVSAAAAAVFLAGFLDTTVHAIAPIEIKGNRLFEYGTDKPFIAKGLDYYPRPNAGLLNINNFDFFTDDHESIWKPHVAEFIALGINAVRLYAVDPSKSHDKFMCALSNAGIYVLIDLASSCEDCAITKDPYPACYPAHLKTRGQQIIAAFSKYNNVLVRSRFWSNVRFLLLHILHLKVLTGYGLNAYLQCDPLAALNPKEIGAGYRNLLSDFTAYQLAIPTLLTEYGCLNVGFPTVDGYAAQRTWLDATWLLSPAFADVFAGGFAFEFLTENQNSKADSPYPFKTFGAQNYGLGYFEPEVCDADSMPCVFHRMPNFDYLAKQYSNATMDHLVGRSAYTPAHTTLPKCPADVPSISGVLWPADKETDMLCPDLTQTPLCPGDVINTGKGSTIKPSVKTVVPVRGVPTVTPSSSMAPPTHETTQGTSAAAASNMLGVIVMAGAAIFAGYV
ncbi:hypothetical protein DYB32_005771 [Aphanomyces invadans]|uniref:1,3-beta-glucanosyltransferase n=1 Tax=Aphanomyces invadans TaxID=157072 RepID=A0A3R6YXN2_9STRA|nr:hypothetical protein DYB32_005771 [Aphanomyces invadans]